MLSVIALMLLLLPFLLLTTSPQKLVGLGLKLPTVQANALAATGEVETLRVELHEDRLVMRAALRRSDVRARTGEVEQWQQVLPHLPQETGQTIQLSEMQRHARVLKEMSPLRQRVVLVPDDSVATEEVVWVMDALREDASGELFPQVALGDAL